MTDLGPPGFFLLPPGLLKAFSPFLQLTMGGPPSPGDRSALPAVRLKGKALTAAGNQRRFEKNGLLDLCGKCKTEAARDSWLDYVYCPKCNTVLHRKSVLPRRIKGTPPAQKEQREKLMEKRARKKTARQKRKGAE